MKSSFTPEEVAQIEDKAYKAGVSVGTHEERLRILVILDKWLNDPYGDFDKTIALIKGETE
jgi:hypothetical protein